MSRVFGNFAKKLRAGKKLGLREAARAMSISAAYLSEVERGDVQPSARLMAAMAGAYGVSLEELRALAEKEGIEHRTPRASLQTMKELRALYRVGGMFTTEEVENILRHTLQESGVSEEEIEREVAKLRADLPRIRKGGRDGLFAAEIKPRFLSKRWIAQQASVFLAKHGYGADEYQPPTPIELIVENEPGVAYRIAHLPSTDGEPLVLGRTRWNGDEREITISADLADSKIEADEHRFRFTLGHEFYHAIEHLPLVGKAELRRTAALTIGLVDYARPRRSPAERAVNRWAATDNHRRLSTQEDWREWQANSFASALLMPEWAVRSQFEARYGAQDTCPEVGANPRQVALQLAGETIVGGKVHENSIAQLFGVSRQAMAIRLLELGIVQEEDG